MTVQLAVELTGDSALNRGWGALRQHDQNIEFPRSDIEGALTFWASQLVRRDSLCAMRVGETRLFVSREVASWFANVFGLHNVECCRIVLDGVEVLGGRPLGRQVGRRRRRDEGTSSRSLARWNRCVNQS